MTCFGGNFNPQLKKRCARCAKGKGFCLVRWVPDATRTYNTAILAFQAWGRASLLGDDTVTRRAYRVFINAEKLWMEMLPTMQANASKTTGNQATPHKARKGGVSGGSDITLALPHLQSIASSLQSLVDIKCLVRYACVTHS
jgi:hypothetical protein